VVGSPGLTCLDGLEIAVWSFSLTVVRGLSRDHRSDRCYAGKWVMTADEQHFTNDGFGNQCSVADTSPHIHGEQ
jgi:hypothetical protein